jgi:hypothetical protein
MRRYLFALLTSLAVLAAIPSASLAKDHPNRDRHARHDRREHARRHARLHNRLERFGTGQGGTTATPAPTTSDAGTVQSFQNNVLVIKLNDGSTISGTIDRNTEVECEAMDENVGRDDGGPGSSGRGAGRDGGDRHGGDNGGGDGNRGGDDDGGNANCLMALQTPGTAVRDASLSVSSAGSFWDRVDLDVATGGTQDS